MNLVSTADTETPRSGAPPGHAGRTLALLLAWGILLATAPGVAALTPGASTLLPRAAQPAQEASRETPEDRDTSEDKDTPDDRETPEELARLIAEHRYEVTGEHGALDGQGLAFLVEEGGASEFLLIGESHNTREIPLLTGRLLEELRPADYEVLAIEVGPLTARWLVDSLEAGGVAALERLVARLPSSVPFFDRREEAELLERALSLGYEVWGLDQEYIGSGRYWLSRLAELAPSDEARRLVDEWIAIERRAVRRFEERRSTDSVLYQLRSPEEFDTLREAFAGSDEALPIVDAMATSARIYQLWRPANYENNRQRIAYMKRNLIEGLRRWEENGRAAPRVLMKFGSYHMGRGLSPASQYDLGTLAQELAVVRGGTSLHVQATAVGRRGENGSFNRWLEPESAWGPFLEQMGEGPWTVFDLRPLRPWFHSSRNREAHPELSELAEKVFQYDVLVIAPEFRRSELLGEDGAG